MFTDLYFYPSIFFESIHFIRTTLKDLLFFLFISAFFASRFSEEFHFLYRVFFDLEIDSNQRNSFVVVVMDGKFCWNLAFKSIVILFDHSLLHVYLKSLQSFVVF